MLGLRMLALVVLCVVHYVGAQAWYKPEYSFSSYDCDRPANVFTQALPGKCCSETPEDEPDHIAKEVQKVVYGILQEVNYFQYNAILCTVKRSRFYYNCATNSHTRMVKPPEISRPVPIGVAECAKIAIYKIWKDSEYGLEHKLNLNKDTTYINHIPIGEMYIYDGYSYCEGEERILNMGSKLQRRRRGVITCAEG